MCGCDISINKMENNVLFRNWKTSTRPSRKRRCRCVIVRVVPLLAAAVLLSALLPLLGPAAGVRDEPEQRVQDDQREDEEHEDHVEPPALAVQAVAGARLVRPQVLLPLNVVGAVVEAGLDAPHARHHLHRAAAGTVAPRQALRSLHVAVLLRHGLLLFVLAALKRNFVYVFSAMRTRFFLDRVVLRDVSN